MRRTRENRLESIARISRGESVLSVGIATVAPLISELPNPPNYFRWVLFGLAVVLVVTVLFRETAIEALAFTSESPFDSYPGLHTKRAWNGGTLKKSNVTRNTLFMIILKEWDEQFYQIYLDLIADYIAKPEKSCIELINKFLPDIYKVLDGKYEFITLNTGREPD